MIGDDDTLFNPLALAQTLIGLNHKASRYLGGRSEVLPSRQKHGWDMAFGGGGLVLSGGVKERHAPALAACLDAVPWSEAPGGDWVLHRCLSALGIPLTPLLGAHQLDYQILGRAGRRRKRAVLDLLENHPVAPFLSAHHPAMAFGPGGPVPSVKRFFEGALNDPLGFLQLTICEIPGSGRAARERSSQLSGLREGGAVQIDAHADARADARVDAQTAAVNGSASLKMFGYAAAVSAGFSVRLWPSPGPGVAHPAAARALWRRAPADVLSQLDSKEADPLDAPVARYEFTQRFSKAVAEAKHSIPNITRSNGDGSSVGSVVLTVYEYSSGGFKISKSGKKDLGFSTSPSKPPYLFVAVAEEAAAGRWRGGPGQSPCHAATLELELEHAAPALLLALRDCSVSPGVAPRVPTRSALLELARAIGGSRINLLSSQRSSSSHAFLRPQ